MSSARCQTLWREARHSFMRILFFSHYYAPEVNAPASRTSEHCRVWVKMGHDVTVVTCAPNHPGGNIYPGYKNRFYAAETVDGVKIIRLWTFIAANEGFARRILNYASYFAAVILALPLLPKTDVIVTTSPQFFCGLVGYGVRLFKRRPWVLEIRDLWPESIVTVGAMRKGLAIRFLEGLERFAYRQADAIVSVTHSFVPHIAALCGDSGKIDIIRNGTDLQVFQRSTDGPRIKRELGLEGRFVAAYVGTHGMAHGLGTVLDAAALLRHDARIAFLMVGDGAERARLVAEKQARQLDNLLILGQRPKADMPGIWAATDASLIVLKRDDMFKKVLPSKMTEAMAMQCPIVLGVEGEAAELLAEAQAGIAITPESAEELAAAVTRLADDPALAARLGANGRQHVLAHFDRSTLAARYIGILETAVARYRKAPGAGQRLGTGP